MSHEANLKTLGQVADPTRPYDIANKRYVDGSKPTPGATIQHSISRIQGLVSTQRQVQYRDWIHETQAPALPTADGATPFPFPMNLISITAYMQTGANFPGKGQTLQVGFYINGTQQRLFDFAGATQPPNPQTWIVPEAQSKLSYPFFSLSITNQTDVGLFYRCGLLMRYIDVTDPDDYL